MQIGEKIRQLRILNQLTQEELANRCELSKGFISQLENDLTSPSIATLIDILQCLGTNLKEFFSDDEEEQIVFHKEDFFAKENESQGQNIWWIVPNAQRNMMEPILMELAPGSQTEIDVPHDGEEFGYCLSGTLQLVVGKKTHTLHRGDTFYYTADRPHYLKNTGKGPAKILWVTTPPNF
ncbi:MAG: helix-turn-helix transcriptional regulator [Firmicutes bacterium]|nr:helix-turn-helix transcriptional regulator [Bacillota bacterium]